MTTETPAPPAEKGVPATASDKADSHLIPKARLDEEIGKRRSLEEQVAQLAQAVLAGIPENLRSLIPTDLNPSAQVAWFMKAKETGVFGGAAVVPSTDAGKPRITPKDQDPSTLAPVSRIAAGYAKRS